MLEPAQRAAAADALWAAQQGRSPMEPLTTVWPDIGAADAYEIQLINIRRQRAEGRTVNVWTADDPRAWERLAALGVDGIITNTPDKLIQWLNR